MGICKTEYVCDCAQTEKGQRASAIAFQRRRRTGTKSGLGDVQLMLPRPVKSQTLKISSQTLKMRAGKKEVGWTYVRVSEEVGWTETV